MLEVLMGKKKEVVIVMAVMCVVAHVTAIF